MAAGHLVRRFFGSLRPGGPSRADTEWAEDQLLQSEVVLWRRMSGADRRHAVGVARQVQRALGHEAERPVLAAALLHDVGKIESNLGTYGRVVATMSAAVAGREAARDWMRGTGMTRRIGMYLLHPTLGGDLLAMAGSNELTVAWTREHHTPMEDWTVPVAIGHVLKDADDD